MNLLAVFLIFISVTFINCSFDRAFLNLKVRVNPETQTKAARDVITRLLGPTKAELFVFKISEASQNAKDGFSILKSEKDGKVTVNGPNGLSLVWGVHYYLKNFCNCHVSWDGDQLNLPAELPLVNLTVKSIDTIRYYQNVCASSYSFVWWDWKRWEREIDWMALNGVNLALAFVGQEAIWQRVYDALGLNSSDFTGPAFLAWNRMGNLRNFGYGLPASWHEKQLALQHKILNRMRDLGIIPILPAFCGIVPKSFRTFYPLSNLTLMSRWNKFTEDFCCPYFLNPSDGLFSIVSRVFMREYISEFGTNHIYNCDMFNENIPASGDPVYLSNISKSVYDEIKHIDPKAFWMIQGWMFINPFWEIKERVKGFLSGVPTGQMIVLDLQSDLTPQYQRLESYFGQPFIWCTLLNFGGQLGMYGHLERINKDVLIGRSFENSTMVGVGITPEGIDQNYLMYDFTLESALRSEPANLSEWISKYALRRYGMFNEDLNEAWLILKETAYNYRPEFLQNEGVNGREFVMLLQGEHISKNILTKMPSLKMNEFTWYNRSRMFDVFNKFLSAAKNENLNSELFKHDFIDVTRQTIQFAVSALYFQLVTDYIQTDYQNFQVTAETFLDILSELDRILGSGEKFLLGKWLEEAKKCGENETETAYYEFNARNQITLWGPNGEIRDYAAKQWSGLINDYYKPRWDIFIKALNHSLIEKVPFNSIATKQKIFLNVEKPFSYDRKVYPKNTKEDPVKVIQEFFKTWEDKLNEIFRNLINDKFEISVSEIP